MTDVTHSDRRSGALRRNLRLLTVDGATWAIMTGTAEWQFALFALAALTIVPISVAQPIFCNGLVLLALYSHFYLKEQLGRRDGSKLGILRTWMYGRTVWY